MKAIGGYFELELNRGNQTYHKTKAFKSGRASLHFILKNVNAKNVYIPFYTCNALLEPFAATGVTYQFYSLNKDLDPIHLPDLKNGEFFLYINYFDLKQDTVEQLVDKYKERLIIDNSQAFFYKGHRFSWSFNSCRKFFGVPDGSYLYAPLDKQKDLDAQFDKNTNYTIEHLLKRFNGSINEGYPFFQENEKCCNAEIKEMSLFTEQMLSNVNFDFCIQQRNENFSFLHQHLSQHNAFNWVHNNKAVPLAYPFLPKKKIPHSTLWNKKVFVPILWKDVLDRREEQFLVENKFAAELLPLPIDQRYNLADMKLIVDSLQNA